MASNNQKYTEEFRVQTAKFIIESGRSATSVAEEMDFPHIKRKKVSVMQDRYLIGIYLDGIKRTFLQ